MVPRTAPSFATVSIQVQTHHVASILAAPAVELRYVNGKGQSVRLLGEASVRLPVTPTEEGRSSYSHSPSASPSPTHTPAPPCPTRPRTRGKSITRVQVQPWCRRCLHSRTWPCKQSRPRLATLPGWRPRHLPVAPGTRHVTATSTTSRPAVPAPAIGTTRPTASAAKPNR